MKTARRRTMAQRIQNIPFAKLINTRDLGGTEGFFREALGFSDSDITAFKKKILQ